MQSIGKTTQLLPVLIAFFFYSTFRTHLCFAADTISSGQSLTYSQTLISKGGKFELGFFKPGTSLNYYIGIWYKDVSIQTVVWVANRDTPLTDPSSSELKLLENGNLVLLTESKITIWSTNLSSISNVSSEAVIGDDGNFFLRTGLTPSDVVWQSFDYPTNTFLPGAKIGYDSRSNKSLTSWKNSNDPAKGIYSLELSGDQYIIQSNQNQYWNSGTWNGESFSLVPEIGLNFNFFFVRNEEESYFTYSFDNTSTLSRLMMDTSGQFKQFVWVPGTQESGTQKWLWLLTWSQPRQQCEVYRYCGAFGVCNQMSLPFCKCLDGFVPRSPKDWNMSVFSKGCVRNTSLQCEIESRFLPVQLLKKPENNRSLDVPNADDCKLSCLNRCSCNAYSFSGSCSLWDGDLFSLQQFQDGDGAVLTIQIKLAASETPILGGKKPLKAYIIVLIAGSVFITILVCFLFGYKLKQRGKSKSRETSLAELSLDHATERGKLELPSFDFNTIVKATNNFSNKLGQGGFGSVYKGKLLDEQEIAVKRLSKSSGQGVQEFKNELVLISKLQHRNLVRLLGYCIDREEKMLVYEYMPNKSLDAFLFDPTRQILLDWEKRFNIIDGIARGLMYLHRDSRLKVIHRDLKASNILLDEDMNPKISDFGMARIFGGKQTLANTNRIVGTYGYMSPEYAMEGIFSEKSDVFSFGVLLLEIVSSKKNRKFYFLEESYNLLGHVWQKWNENKDFELMDPTVAESYNLQQFTRCIHIGLLCVQESAYDRPTMSSIVFMLGSEGALPLPKKPAFTIEKAQISDSIFNTSGAISINSITITNPEGR